MFKLKKELFFFIGSLLMAASLAACAGWEQERLWLNASGWSRAQWVDNTQVGDPVSVALDNTGNLVFFLVVEDEGGFRPRLVTLNRQGEVIWDKTYELVLTQPSDPRVLWDGEALQLFWLSGRGLYHSQTDLTGTLKDSPTLISGEIKINDYAAVLDVDGSTTVWFAGSRRSPGLYALPPGDFGGAAQLVDEMGVRPALQYDEAGTLHATWAHHPPGYGERRFFYATYPDGVFRSGQATEVVEPMVGPTSVLYGPTMGLDRQQVYLFWTVEIRTGMEAGKLSTEYVHFDLGQPGTVSSPRPLYIPVDYHLTYQPFPEGDLEAGDRVTLAGGDFGITGYVGDIAPDSAINQEMVVALSAQLNYLRNKREAQVSTLFFREGLPTSYQLLSFTATYSAAPAIFSDPEGHLYVTWLERGDLPGFRVYFASTAPDIRNALNSITLADVGRVTGETLFGLAGGALLVPVVLVWMAVVVVVVGITSVVRGEEQTFTSPGTLISLVLALVAYWVIKSVSLPDMYSYVPFSAWMPFLPQWLGLPLRVGVPLLIALLALWVAWRYTFSQERSSVLFFSLIYVAVDGVLTLAVYGLIIYGAF